jgi:hypothetical protein
MRLSMFATSSQCNVKRFVLAMSEPVSNFALRKDLARQHGALPSLSTEKKEIPFSSIQATHSLVPHISEKRTEAS